MTREDLAQAIRDAVGGEAGDYAEEEVDVVLALLEGHAIVGGQPVRMTSDDPLVFVLIDGKAITD